MPTEKIIDAEFEELPRALPAGKTAPAPQVQTVPPAQPPSLLSVVAGALGTLSTLPFLSEEKRKQAQEAAALAASADPHVQAALQAGKNVAGLAKPYLRPGLQPRPLNGIVEDQTRARRASPKKK